VWELSEGREEVISVSSCLVPGICWVNCLPRGEHVGLAPSLGHKEETQSALHVGFTSFEVPNLDLGMGDCLDFILASAT
jgi:hypothetical protein